MRYNSSEVIDLPDERVKMDDELDEPCLEGSDDDLDLRLSEDEERLVNNNNDM